MKTAFLISKPFGLKILKSLKNELESTLVIHPNDERDSRGCAKLYTEYCNRENIDIKFISNKQQANEQLIRYKPDLIFVCGWYWILPDHILEIPKLGVYGIHNSILPMYRGFSPLVWSIIDGGHTVGSSLFKFDGGMDTGDIIYQFKLEFPRKNNISNAMTSIENEYVKVIPKIWDDLKKGNPSLKKQDNKKALFCAKRNHGDGRINWLLPAEIVHDFVRAQSSPYPGAFTTLDNEKVIIEKTVEINERWISTPGQVIRINSNGSVLVGAGHNTALLLERIFNAKGLNVNASDVINSTICRLN